MSHPVVTLGTVSKVSRIVSVLRSEMHDGFPVVSCEACEEIQPGQDFMVCKTWNDLISFPFQSDGFLHTKSIINMRVNQCDVM